VQPAGRPEVDAVYGIPPTVAIEQRLSRGGRKSTVGTTTEVWHFLRLLYVKLGTQHCIHDGAAGAAASRPTASPRSCSKTYRGQHIGLLAPLVVGRKGVYTELADWARPRGYTHLRVDGNFLPTTSFPRIDRFKEHNIELPVASLDVTPAQRGRAARSAGRCAARMARAWCRCSATLDGLREAMAGWHSGRRHRQGAGVLHQARLPGVLYLVRRAGPAPVQLQQQTRLVPDCVGTGVALDQGAAQGV